MKDPARLALKAGTLARPSESLRVDPIVTNESLTRTRMLILTLSLVKVGSPCTTGATAVLGAIVSIGAVDTRVDTGVLTTGA